MPPLLQPHFRIFPSSLKILLNSFAVNLNSHSSQATTNLLSDRIKLSFLDISYKWNQRICAPLYWTLSYSMFLTFIYMCVSAVHPFLLLIAFYYIDIPNFFIHSFVDRRLVCFHFLAIMKNTMITVHKFVWMYASIFLGIYLGVHSHDLGYRVISCSIF